MAIPFVDDLVVAVAVVLITNAKQMTALLNHFTFTVHHIQKSNWKCPTLSPASRRTTQNSNFSIRFVVTFFYVNLIWFLFGHSPTIQSYWPFRFYCISLRTLRTYTIITFVRSESTKCIAQSKQFEDSISFRYLLQSDLISIYILFTFCLCSHNEHTRIESTLRKLILQNVFNATMNHETMKWTLYSPFMMSLMQFEQCDGNR